MSDWIAGAVVERSAAPEKSERAGGEVCALASVDMLNARKANRRSSVRCPMSQIAEGSSKRRNMAPRLFTLGRRCLFLWLLIPAGCPSTQYSLAPTRCDEFCAVKQR